MIKKRELKKKKKQQTTVDYFPRGNIFLNETSTQIESKAIKPDFLFNEAPIALQQDKKERKR